MNKSNKYIDHTLLKPTATKSDIDKLVKEAIKYDFASVCINPSWVKYASRLLSGSDVMTCTVIGFPLGANDTDVKAFETTTAIADGADEIDMVINIGKVIEGDWNYVTDDIKDVVEAANGRTVKVILETCLLTEEQIVKACNCCVKARAHFVKTSTGFSTGGATVEAVKLMKKTVGEKCQVKASGGIRNKEDFMAMIKAGATRIGTSAGVELMDGKESKSAY